MARRQRLSTARDGTASLLAFLTQEGFLDQQSQAAAMQILIRVGLTRPGKQAIHGSKLDHARQALASGLLRLCPDADCRRLTSGSDLAIIDVAAQSCDVCAGSDNRRGMAEMVAACRYASVARLLIVGGTPAVEQALQDTLLGDALEVRFLRGTEATVRLPDALVLCRWADLVVVWAPTPLPHKISNLFSAEVCDADRVVVHRRGLAALAGEVVVHLARRVGTAGDGRQPR